MNEQILNILEPYYSAGKRYGWEGYGVGINAAFLKGTGNLRITIGDRPTVRVLSRERARQLARHYMAYEFARSTKLVILPLNEFELENRGILSLDLETETVDG